MQGSWEAIDLAEVPIWLKRELTQGEFFLELALLVAVLTVVVLGFAVVVIWMASRTESLRERFFPLQSCDPHTIGAISAVLMDLSRESKRYDFIALRVRPGTWHAKRWTFIWGTFGAMTTGEGGPEWGSCECAFVLALRSEEENLRKYGGMFPFLFCGKDLCILRLKESKLSEVTFSRVENP